jgi:hypothetical protein
LLPPILRRSGFEMKNPEVTFFAAPITGGAIFLDGLVKSPSAALRFTFVIAVPEEQSPQGPHFSFFARLPPGAFYETIFLIRA